MGDCPGNPIVRPSCGLDRLPKDGKFSLVRRSSSSIASIGQTAARLYKLGADTGSSANLWVALAVFGKISVFAVFMRHVLHLHFVDAFSYQVSVQ